MFKYRGAFARNDKERYDEFLNKVSTGEAKLNAARTRPKFIGGERAKYE